MSCVSAYDIREMRMHYVGENHEKSMLSTRPDPHTRLIAHQYMLYLNYGLSQLRVPSRHHPRLSYRLSQLSRAPPKQIIYLN